MSKFSPTDDLQDIRSVWLAESGLTIHERAVLTVLLCHRNGKTGQLNPSLTRIAKEAKMGRSTVARVLKKLEGSGRIRRNAGREGRRTTSYVVLRPGSPGAGLVPERDQSRSDMGVVPERDQVVPERDGGSPGAGHERTKRTSEVTDEGTDERTELSDSGESDLRASFFVDARHVERGDPQILAMAWRDGLTVADASWVLEGYRRATEDYAVDVDSGTSKLVAGALRDLARKGPYRFSRSRFVAFVASAIRHRYADHADAEDDVAYVREAWPVEAT